MGDDSNAKPEHHQKKVDLPQKLSELDVDEILSCTRVEVTNTDTTTNSSGTTDQPPHLNDIELDDLDERIAEKLDQIKARSINSPPGGAAESSRWLLREESGAHKRRWLVTRSVENELEISVDLIGLESKPEQS